MKTRSVLVIFALLLFAGCRREPVIRDKGMLTGTVELLDGKALPFRVSLDFSGERPSGYFLVGDEKTPIPEISRNGDALTFGFSEYGAEMRGTLNGAEWAGEYLRHRSTGTKSFKFRAAPEGSASAVDSTNSSAAGTLPAGNYQVYFEGEDEATATTVAKFWDKDGTLHGTFIAPDGDYGLLVGQQTGTGFQLNRFTGWQAIVIALEQSAGKWTGKFYAASNDEPRAFRLEPRANLDIEPPASLQTRMKNPNAPFTFSGISLSGETVRSTDDRFKGKALLVDIMGTWCHNCLDSAPLLQQLHDRYGKDGFEVVGLSFEISDDPALAKKNLQLYKERFGLTYTLLFCGSLDDANVEKQLSSQLENFFAYPTSIFIDRKQSVRHIHSGFKGPGTGDEYQRQVQQFDQYAKELLN